MPLHFISLFMVLWAFANSCKTAEKSDPSQETDDRTTEVTKLLVDVSPQLNAHINEAIAKARLEVNPDANAWTDELKFKLIENLGERLAKLRPGSGVGIHWLGFNVEVSKLTEIEGRLIDELKEEQHQIHRTKFADSRYGDNPLGLRKALVMSHVNQSTADHSISPAVRIGTVIVGLDKIGHFAEEGLWYFLAEQRQQLQGVEERREFGLFMEGDPDLDPKLYPRYKEIYGSFCKTCVILGGFGYFGMVSTGVCSIGDVEANESGYQFFSALYADAEGYHFDILNFDLSKWNEETSPSKYKKELLIRKG